MDDATAISEPAQELQTPAHWWKPGQSGNPKGREKGSRNKLGEAFVADLYEDWKHHGVSAIAKVRDDKPDAYLKVIASILPKEISVKQLDNLSDDELIARLHELERIVRPFLATHVEGEVIDGARSQAQ